MRDPETARFYDISNDPLVADVEMYARLAAEEGGPVCELGAGTGRVGVPIARAGVEVTGVDLSSAMLDRYRMRLEAEPESVRARVRLVLGDMRAWGRDAAFRQVFMPFRVFLLNLTRADRHACLVNCRRILVPGGRLVFNVFHPSQAYMRQYSYENAGAWHDLDTWPTPEGGTLLQSHSAAYDRVEKRIHVVFRWLETRPGGEVRFVEEPFDLAYLYRDEVLLHLEAAGLEVEAVFGGFDGRPLSAEGDEMVFFARRPAPAHPPRPE